MSKSYGNTIPVFAKGKALKKAINAIVTDSKDPAKEPLDPETCNAFAIHALFASEAEQEELAEAYRRAPEVDFLGYGITKKKIREAMEERFGPARERYEQLMADEDEIEDVLAAGAKRARALARETVDACREACGLGSPRKG
jgi:tryptophanyl-tRNA synthetase